MVNQKSLVACTNFNWKKKKNAQFSIRIYNEFIDASKFSLTAVQSDESYL